MMTDVSNGIDETRRKRLNSFLEWNVAGKRNIQYWKRMKKNSNIK